MKVLVINGVNLNMLGIREPEKYGTLTLDEVNSAISKKAHELGIEVDFYQSNIEGEIVNALHKARGVYGGIIINPGAYTHYSYAIRDAIPICEVPVIEVHMTNIHAREEFRHKSVLTEVCKGQIAGFGVNSYILALMELKSYDK